MKPSLSLKRIGIWTGAFEPQPARKVQETVVELEELGYGAVWFSEGFGRETFTQSALLLAGSTRIVVASGIANIYGRESGFAARLAAVGDVWPSSTGTAFSPVVSVINSRMRASENDRTVEP